MKKIVPIRKDEDNQEPPFIREKAPPNTVRFIARYSLVLLGVAFFIILLSYLSHQQQWADIQARQSLFSESALQSIESLRQENERLGKELEQTREDRETLQDQVEEIEATLRDSEKQRIQEEQEYQSSLEALETNWKREERKSVALGNLWKAEALFQAREYGAAREVLDEMKRKKQTDDLPDIASEGMETPAAAFWRMYDAIE